MNKHQVLVQLSENKISVNEAYQYIYEKNRKLKKAHFIKFKFHIAESKGANALLFILFLLPIPIVVIKIFLKLLAKNEYIHISGQEVPIKDFIQLIALKDINIDVKAKDEAHIKIKTF